MSSTNEDILMLDASIENMRHVFEHLRQMAVVEARKTLQDLVGKVKVLYSGKESEDTRFFDIVAEDGISLGHDFQGHYPSFQRVYNGDGVVVTEERGKIGDTRIEHSTPVIITDPVDRSSYVGRLIEEFGERCSTMGELFDMERENIGDDRARLESCNSSVTLLKDNTIKYSLILNLLTGELFVAYEGGVFCGDINKNDALENFKNEVHFRQDEEISMLCYTQEGKYESNRKGTHLRFFDLDGTIKSPGGPNRFIYLVSEDGTPISNIGAVAHNGEKIQEILPNIAVAYFSQGELVAYKLFCDRNLHEQRGGKSLTPNLENSLYCGDIWRRGINLGFLNNHRYPSEFRDTTIIVPSGNERAIAMLEGMVQEQDAIRIV